jgi:hypothetical protein
MVVSVAETPVKIPAGTVEGGERKRTTAEASKDAMRWTEAASFFS